MADRTTDAVVIGAGVIGCSVAYELARGGRRVVCVDRGGGAGQGSTSASSAIVRFFYSTWDGVAASWEARHCWEVWRDHLGAADGELLARFVRSGCLVLDAPPMDRGRVLQLFDRAGIPYDEWDADSIRARVPGIDLARHWPPKTLADPAFWADGTGELTGFFTPDAGYVDDPQLAAQNLMSAAARHGAEFVFHAEVTHVRRSAGRVAGVTLADGSAIHAPVVVNVTGPHSSYVNALAGVLDDFTVSTRPMRQEVDHLAAPPGFNSDDLPGPVVADLDLGTYLRGAPGDGVLVGGTEPECDTLQWLDDPDAANPHVTVDVFEAQVTRAARRLPALHVPGAPTGIAGVYDVADDWTPIYDRTLLPGFYVAIGTSGNQFKNAPVAGSFLRSIVDACESGHDHDADPVRWTGQHTGLTINLGAFSRRREINRDSSFTVMG